LKQDCSRRSPRYSEYILWSESLTQCYSGVCCVTRRLWNQLKGPLPIPKTLNPNEIVSTVPRLKTLLPKLILFLSTCSTMFGSDYCNLAIPLSLESRCARVNYTGMFPLTMSIMSISCSRSRLPRKSFQGSEGYSLVLLVLDVCFSQTEYYAPRTAR
jgi:hypothetical protein